MQDLFLVSPIPPSVNHYLAYRVVYTKGKPMAVSYKTKEATQYKSDFTKYVIDEVEKQGWSLEPNSTQHFYIDTVFYFPTIRVDPNNYYKLPLDAITDSKKIWLDDNVTCERVQGIYYDSQNPRMEMHIHPVDYIGVFADSDQFNNFKIDNCFKCSRYAKNCSILSKAIEGRIQSEIDLENCKCIKFKEKKEIKANAKKKEN